MPKKHHIRIVRGTAFTRTMPADKYVNDLSDLTGYSGNSSIRDTFADANTLFTFDTSLSVINNTVTIAMSNTDVLEEGRYVYDVTLTVGNTEVEFVEGYVDVANTDAPFNRPEWE